MSDIIERLKARAAPLTRARELSPTAALCREAAAEIERLRSELANHLRAQPQQPAETVAAGAIIDIMSGGKLDWRSRIDEGDFLESADWQNALAYARAALSCAQPQGARK